MKITHLDHCAEQGLSHDAEIVKKILFHENELPASVRLSHAVFKPGQKASAHSHDDLYEIFYVISGSGLFRINGDEYQVTTGSCMRIDPGELHEVINDSHDDMIMIYFGLAQSEGNIA
ncbi:MAG: cupin domain-containing protein [Mariprofundus sp.]|nr:cupin domain-containing protein [Mariprofundus sp.]